MDYPVIYEVDRDGVITHVNDAWNHFARENDSPNLIADEVIGSKLADHISSIELRHLFQAVYERARIEETFITLPFRCDSPDTERLLEMRITPLQTDGLQFTINPISLSTREPIHLLNMNLDHSHGLISMCSWCKSIQVKENQWEELSAAIKDLGIFETSELPRITHGICKPCGEKFLREGLTA